MFLWQGYVERVFVLSKTAVAQAARFRISRPADTEEKIGKHQLIVACMLRTGAVACVQQLCNIICWELG